MARPEIDTRNRSTFIRILLGLYGVCASLKLAVILIATCTIVLIWATFVEVRYGTSAVHFGIYGSLWFGLLLALLGANVLCAALIRFPWSKRQIGFLLTHAGILVLLVGCLVTKLNGIDARLPVFEGHSASLAFEDSQHLELTILPRHKKATVETIDIPFSAGPFNWQDYNSMTWFPWQLANRSQGVLYDSGGVKLEVLDYYSDSQEVAIPQLKLRVIDSPKRQTGLAIDSGQLVTLNIKTTRHPHGAHRRFGIGDRHRLPTGQRITFWMTDNKSETVAFQNSRPKESIGPQGQLILYVAGKPHYLSVDKLEPHKRQPLDKTGLEVELVRLDDKLLGVELLIHAKNKKPQRLLLFADFPEFNRQDYQNEVFGTYWFDANQKKGLEKFAASAISRAKRPRMDILLGSDHKLRYRTWNSSKVGAIGELPVDGKQVDVFSKTDRPLTLSVETFMPSDSPTVAVLPLPFAKGKNDALKERQARLRLTVDDTVEEFWLNGLSADPFQPTPSPNQRKIVSGKQRRTVVTMPRDTLDIGFQIHLHKFKRELDPGTDMASYYASIVDFLDRDDKNKRLKENVLITLNAPVDFLDPTTGRSYRLFQSSFQGPWHPGEEVFDKLAKNDTKDQLFQSWLTVNYDPGRGIKYAGCWLIAIGMILIYSMAGRARKKKIC